jgi:hypothetical protein
MRHLAADVDAQNFAVAVQVLKVLVESGAEAVTEAQYCPVPSRILVEPLDLTLVVVAVDILVAVVL